MTNKYPLQNRMLYVTFHYSVIDSKLLIIDQASKKLRKGKSVQVIADELEEEIEQIREIVDVAGKYAPEYDVKNIMDDLRKRNSASLYYGEFIMILNKERD